MIVTIVYKCWGCGSTKIEEEEAEPLEDCSRHEEEHWNVCPDCIERGDK